MKKILLVSDSPYATTGLGRISDSLLKMLPEFEWVIWGFLHPEWHVRHGQWLPLYKKEDYEAEFKLLSPRTYTDNQYGFDFIPSLIEQEEPDFVITTVDFDRILQINKPLKDLQFKHDFKWINYFPVDRMDFKELELDAFRYPDINVCYSQYGVDVLHSYNDKLDIRAIRCAVNADDFPRISDEKLKEFKKGTWKSVNDDTYMVGTFNRSFARKDTPRTVKAFSEFLKVIPNSFAYVHGSRRTFEGMDLGKLAYENGAPEGRLSFEPKGFTEVEGVSQDTLNNMYRSMDMFVTASSGEGFGYTAVEALLCGVPVIAPKHTTFPELVQDFGYLIEPKAMTFHTNASTSMWPILHVNDIVDQMIYVYEHEKEAKAKARKGAKWVKENLNFKVIGDQWREILK